MARPDPGLSELRRALASALRDSPHGDLRLIVPNPDGGRWEIQCELAGVDHNGSWGNTAPVEITVRTKGAVMTVR